MSVRCNACGFDSADDAQWCDFCKEPFRKKSAAAEPAPAAVPSHSPANVKEPEAKVDPKVQLLLKQLSTAGDGLTLPKLPPWFKYVAWSFFGAWFLTGAILGGIMLARYREQSAAREGDPSQPHVQIIRTP